MPENQVKVTATAYTLKGTKGSISFKWKSKEHLTSENEKEFIENLETLIGHQIQKFAE